MPAKKPLRDQPQFQSSEKVMQTFRIPRELTFAKGEAAGRGIDLTAYVVRLLGGPPAPRVGPRAGSARAA